MNKSVKKEKTKAANQTASKKGEVASPETESLAQVTVSIPHNALLRLHKIKETTGIPIQFLAQRIVEAQMKKKKDWCDEKRETVNFRFPVFSINKLKRIAKANNNIQYGRLITKMLVAGLDDEEKAAKIR